MRPADQIEATAERAIADLTALRVVHSRRRRPGTDGADVDGSGPPTVSDGADD